MIRLLLSAVLLLLMSGTINYSCSVVNGVVHGKCPNIKIGKEPFQTISGEQSLSGNYEGVHVLRGGHLRASGNFDLIIVDQGGFARISGIVDQAEVSGKVRSSGIIKHVILKDGGEMESSGIIEEISGFGTIIMKAGSILSGKSIEHEKLIEIR